MEAIDKDSLIHPMMLLKRGDCFGTESTIGEEGPLCGYRAVGGVAELVSIPSEVVSELIKENPSFSETMHALHKKRLETFQKLMPKS